MKEAGPPDDKILLFLHNFPEFWNAWRNQISFFASKGHRVVVPDQQGHDISAKPAGIKAYRMHNQLRDVPELIGHEKAEEVKQLMEGFVQE